MPTKSSAAPTANTANATNMTTKTATSAITATTNATANNTITTTLNQSGNRMGWTNFLILLCYLDEFPLDSVFFDFLFESPSNLYPFRQLFHLITP